MGSANQESTRFEYRNHVYEMSVDKCNNVYTEIFAMGSESALYWSIESTSWMERKAKTAVRKAHVWARNLIDRRLVVLNAIHDVDENGCRGLEIPV